MGEVVSLPIRNRARILIHRAGDGEGYLIDHVSPSGGSYGLCARAETLEDAEVAAQIASNRYGKLPIEVRP